jgi:type I restriction-modification system DNA methylase subunit
VLLEVLEEVAAVGGRLPFGRHTLTVPGSVLWKAIQEVARLSFTRDRYSGEFVSIPSLAQPMAYLLGLEVAGMVFDPFMGVGSSLWAVGDRAEEVGSLVTLRGVEVNPHIAELASRLAELSPHDLALEVGNSFHLGKAAIADFVVSEPPMSLRLPQPYRLNDVGDSTEADLAAVDVALKALKPRGRAVLHLPLAWTARTGIGERYRDYLLDATRVVALIGLPTGVYPNANVASVLLVLDKVPRTGRTFVAQLGEDWATELGPGGGALTAFYQHASSFSS